MAEIIEVQQKEELFSMDVEVDEVTNQLSHLNPQQKEDL